MKVVRIIIYEGSEEEVKHQLSGSLPDGRATHIHKLEVTVVTLGTIPDYLNLLPQKGIKE